MTLSFTCTYDDFLEAQRVHRRPARSDRLGLGERLLFLWILFAAIGAVVTIAIAEAIAGIVRGGPTIDATFTNWAIAILVPWMPWVLVTGLLWYAMSGVAGPREREPARQMLLIIAAVHLVVTALVTILSGGPHAQQARAAAAATQPVDDVPWIVTLLPWLTIFFVVWIYAFRYVRGLLPRHWDAQPHLRLPQTLAVTPRGLRFEDERAVLDYAWAGLPKFRESETLFLIYVSEVSFHMVPKRAMTEPGQVETFRQLLEQHVPTDGPVPARFPVQPMAPQALASAVR